MLAGERGEAVQRAMEIVVTLGRIYDAERLLPIESVQVAGVSYRNLGEAGLEFLRDWADKGARVRVRTTLNPAGMDLKNWRRMGISESFAGKQAEVVEVYTSMGIQPTCTCAPYLVGNMPQYGQHVAWSESSAVSYANSVLGARTNREGGPSALAAAIAGRTADYGLHLDQNRRATHRVEVRCPVRRPYEFAALGYLVGREIGNGVPCFCGLELGAVGCKPSSFENDGPHSQPLSQSWERGAAVRRRRPLPLPELGEEGGWEMVRASGTGRTQDPPLHSHPLVIPPGSKRSPLASAQSEAQTRDALRLMGAALASSGAVALYHVEGVTPEARARLHLCPGDAPRLVVDSLHDAIGALNSSVQSIDLVALGCPHASLDEIERLAESLRGKHLSADLWVTVARGVREQAETMGLVEIIEEAGGLVIADGCVVVAPMEEIGYRSLATNSAKMASYARSHAGLKVRFGCLERCLSAAISGRWDAGRPECR